MIIWEKYGENNHQLDYYGKKWSNSISGTPRPSMTHLYILYQNRQQCGERMNQLSFIHQSLWEKL